MISNPFERKQIEWRTSLTSFSAQTVIIKMLSQLEQSIYAETTTAVIEKGQLATGLAVFSILSLSPNVCLFIRVSIFEFRPILILTYQASFIM